MATSRPMKHGSAGSTRSTLSGSSRSSTGSAGRQQRSCSLDGVSPKSKPRPSDKLNPKTIDPFAGGSRKLTAFASVYNSGGVPCRLIHGSVKHKLAWSVSPETLPFDPLLITLAEGLREKVHPYAFVAQHGFQELLEVPDSGQKAGPLMAKIIPPLKAALTDSDGAVFEAALNAVGHLSNSTGPALNPYLKMILVPMAKRGMEKKYKDVVMDTMQQLELNGGRDALVPIKAKMPTYLSINN